MSTHLHIVLLADGYDLLEKVGDALPIVVGADSACPSHRQVSPILLKLKRTISDTTSSGFMRVSPNWDYSPMMGYDLHTYLRCLLDVTNDDVELPIAFGTFGKPDIVVVHSYGFECHPGFIAIVLHLLQLIGVPGAVGTSLAYLRREMLDTVAQVIFQICLCRHIGARSPGHAMVAASDA